MPNGTPSPDLQMQTPAYATTITVTRHTSPRAHKVRQQRVCTLPQGYTCPRPSLVLFLMAMWNFLSVLYRHTHCACVEQGAQRWDQLKCSQVMAFDTCFSGEILTNYMGQAPIWNGTQWALAFAFCNEVKAFLLQCEIKATRYSLVCATSHVGVSAICSHTGDDIPPNAVQRLQDIFTESRNSWDWKRPLEIA